MPSLFPFDPTDILFLGLGTASLPVTPTPRTVFVPSKGANAGAYRLHAHPLGDDYPELGAREGEQVFDLRLTDFLPAEATVLNIPQVVVSQYAPDDTVSDVSARLLQGTVLDGTDLYVVLGGATTDTRALPGASYTITAQITASTGQDFEVITDRIYCPPDS